MDKCYDPKSENYSEHNCVWVEFPSRTGYLLPSVGKQQKFSPTFDGDEVVLDVTSPDPHLVELVTNFLHNSSNSEELVANGVKLTPKAYVDFMLLVRGLLQKNYAFSNDQLKAILTFDRNGLKMLFNTIFRHVTGD